MISKRHYQPHLVKSSSLSLCFVCEEAGKVVVLDVVTENKGSDG
jgi:hypothetical protein